VHQFPQSKVHHFVAGSEVGLGARRAWGALLRPRVSRQARWQRDSRL